MAIGIFDSGLGGLVITKALREAMPDYDFLYLGDTLHVPYGPRSHDAIYGFSERAMDYLFAQGCPLVIVACNTASASALRQLQQQYLPKKYPDRRILGVVVPTIEEAIDSGYKNIGLIGTAYTVNSGVYPDELGKLNDGIRVIGKTTPLLVPLIENNGLCYTKPVLQDYLQPLLDQNIDSLILGCTHYPLLKDLLKEILPSDVGILSQDDLIPPKMVDYLERHPEMDARLSKNGQLKVVLTDVTQAYQTVADDLMTETIPLEKVTI